MFLEMFTLIGALVGASITLVAAPHALFILFGLVLLASWVVLFLRRRQRWQPVPSQDRFSHCLELQGSYYVRILASMLYFAMAAHNWKYTSFTAFVLSVLTYSLFLR